MRFTSLVLKNLTRRPLRTGLTLLAFATAIAAVISLLGITNGFTQSFADVYESHGVDVVVSRQGTADRLSSSVDHDFVNQINQIEGVSKSAGVLLETMSLEDQEIYGIPSMGIQTGSWLLDDYQIESIAGSSNTANQKSNRHVMLGTHLAERVNVQVGQEVMIFDEPYLVTGIFSSQSAWENGSIIFPLSVLQELTDRVGQVTYINVVLEASQNQDSGSQIVEQIQSLDAKLHALTTDEFVKTDTRMQIAKAMAWMTSMVALIIGAIGTLNTMMTSVLERTREIGILRAIGWPKRRIVGMICLESVLLAAAASVLGGILAVGLTWLLSRTESSGILTPAIDFGILAQGAVIGLVIGLLGAALPAWRAAQMMPTEAFRDT